MAKAKTPYDYFVVVDAGSHGSRVYVYRWLTPLHALEQGMDLTAQPRVSLVREFTGAAEPIDVREFQGSERLESLVNPAQSGPTPSGSGPEFAGLLQKLGSSERDSDSDSDSDSEADPDSAKAGGILPSVFTGKKWHLKIKPGVSTFNESPQKVGKHHLSYLLHLAGKVVPKSEHGRTPFFFHATAGMRLLPPNEQEPIIENICRYVSEESDFFMPDCLSHVNIIDGNIEGLYGWLAINQMIGSFDYPEKHQHGKNHTTYGLLDMGGASTQVVFQPNQTEIVEHMNNIYRVSLWALPKLKTGAQSENSTSGGASSEGADSDYHIPEPLDSSVYSGSYLGFGMFQARARYLKTLLQEFRDLNDLPDETFRFKTPVPDPCVPKGYTFEGEIDENAVDFTGSSDFNGCLESIFPVLANNTYNSDKKYPGDCKKLSSENEVSLCLLNDLIPSIDFSINHFIGVSGYWDTINSLFESQMPIKGNDDRSKLQEKYDYNLIYSKTQKLCLLSLNELLEMNLLKKMKQEDLADLCFRSSWILNFLHVGLGFPRFGLDDTDQEKFKSLEFAEKLGGLAFSWTLGRAILYANDEYTQAYNNYTIKRGGEPLSRPGYIYTASENFVFGAEARGIPARPAYGDNTGPELHYDYENEATPTSLSWTIKPHRVYGEIVFLVLLLGVLFLMFGKLTRAKVLGLIREKYVSLRRKVSYTRLEEEPIEMSSMQAHKDDELFEIGEA